MESSSSLPVPSCPFLYICSKGVDRNTYIRQLYGSRHTNVMLQSLKYTARNPILQGVIVPESGANGAECSRASMPDVTRNDPACNSVVRIASSGLCDHLTELGSLGGLELSVNCTDGGFKWTVGGYYMNAWHVIALRGSAGGVYSPKIGPGFGCGYSGETSRARL